MAVDEAAAPLTAEDLVRRVEDLTQALEDIADPFAKAIAEDLVGAVLDLYGEGLQRVLAALDEAGDPGAALRARLVDDGVFASLLLIHGLYPVALEDRVQEALESVRPYMDSHGGNVTLVSLEDGVATLRLEGSCHGCAASQSTLELAIEQALAETAPDLLELRVEGVAPRASSGAEPRWEALPMLQIVNGNDSVRQMTLGGRSLVVATIGTNTLAFADLCAACGAELHAGALKGGVLHCPGCEHRFYLPTAGRSLERDGLQLEPVPLLPMEEGGFKVAVTT